MMYNRISQLSKCGCHCHHKVQNWSSDSTNRVTAFELSSVTSGDHNLSCLWLAEAIHMYYFLVVVVVLR